MYVTASFWLILQFPFVSAVRCSRLGSKVSYSKHPLAIFQERNIRAMSRRVVETLFRRVHAPQREQLLQLWLYWWW